MVYDFYLKGRHPREDENKAPEQKGDNFWRYAFDQSRADGSTDDPSAEELTKGSPFHIPETE